MKRSLTATNLAIYQHLNCDLYIHNIYNGAKGSAGTELSSSPSELTKAHYKRGLEWESVLYAWLDDSNLLLTVPQIPVEGDTLLENIFADDRNYFFIAGVTFWPPEAQLAEKFKESLSPPLHFGLAKPDLLEIRRTNDGIQWRVIDAKASQHVKVSHHTQVYFYTLCLNFILQSPHFRGQDSAGVWLPPKDGFHTDPPSLSDISSISLPLLAPPLDTLLFRTLPRVVAQPRESVKWHFNPLCQGCRFESGCKSRVLEEGQLGVMPNISIDDSRTLKDLLRMSRVTPPIPKPLADIEELHNLFSNRHKLERLRKLSPSVVKKANQILALPKKTCRNEETKRSPLVEAAREKTILVIPRRNYTCPSKEDIAIFISIVNDPSSPDTGGSYFHVSSFPQRIGVSTPTINVSCAEDFIPKLANLIKSLESSGRASQFYVWSSGEQALLQMHIINAALTSAASETDIRSCIGALSQGASLLQTAFQPLLLSGALMSFLAKGRKQKPDYERCLARLGLSTEGTVEVLRKRLEGEVQHIQARVNSSNDENRQKAFGQLLKVVVLKKEVERQLALPVPGYWDLPECLNQLQNQLGTNTHPCPNDEEILTAYKKNEDTVVLDSLLSQRSRNMFDVLKALRLYAVSTTGNSLFVNEAKKITTQFMDFCIQPQIRKLFFMQQFEVLAKLTELWQSRIDGCPDALTLEYRGLRQGMGGEQHTFRVISGAIDVPFTEKDRAFYDKLLVMDTPDSLLDEDGSDKLPVEALFDDLGVSGLVFPLNGYTKANWGRQDSRLRRELWIADLKNVYTDPSGCGTMVTLRTWGTCQTPLVQGVLYRLSPRLVDFNTTKILSALFELDLEWKSALDNLSSQEVECHPHAFIPFVQLMLDPTSLGQVPNAEQYVKIENDIQRLFRDLRELGNEKAGSLVLKASQHRAVQRIMTNRLSVIWGPPGTGKTYTISLSLLRLIEVERRQSGLQSKIIFITAVTHAAIEACRSKLVRLLHTYQSIQHLSKNWLDDVSVEVVTTGNDHPGPIRGGSTVHIYMGTIYQFYNFTKKHSMEVDCVVIDEAGQISLGSMALVLRSLAPCGRVVVAGDSEQLAPILSAQYPLLKSHALFGSVLDCLMFSNSSLAANDTGHTPSQDAHESQSFDFPTSQRTIIQLTENFRLNPDLGEFVSTIYSRQFKPQKVQARQLATALKTLADMNGRYTGINPRIFGAVQIFLTSLSDVMFKRPQNVLVAPEMHPIMPTNVFSGKGKMCEVAPTHRPVSLALIRLRTWSAHSQNISYELHVQAEAAVAAALVLCLQSCSPNDDIFVATPHRIQREAVKVALRKIKGNELNLEAVFGQLQVSNSDGASSRVTVDTIERLQGSEASFVICLFSVPKSYTTNLCFLLERRRLNVAISRAKTLCVLISSDEVLCPSVKILANADAAKGYAFLKAFQRRAWSYNLPVKVDGLQI